ncbi:hypothetical protein AGR4B_Lc60474 [Agrobacterium tumefaciens str. CFBP 5621]|nr:hypothetical protein AGR4B_Lc60474 [Agrobacterium tumefaciens str. CFBP 5621]
MASFTTFGSFIGNFYGRNFEFLLKIVFEWSHLFSTENIEKRFFAPDGFVVTFHWSSNQGKG